MERGAYIVALHTQTFHPVHQRGTSKLAFCLFCQIDKISHMPGACRFLLSLVKEMLMGILAYQLMDIITGPMPASLFYDDQRLLYQGGGQLEHIHVTDGLRRLQCPATCEHGQLPQECLFRLAQQTPAPLHRTSYRLLARQDRPRVAGKQRKGLLQLLQDLLHLQDVHTRRGQLNGQRDAVHFAADIHHSLNIFLRQLKRRQDQRRAFGK